MSNAAIISIAEQGNKLADKLLGIKASYKIPIEISSGDDSGDQSIVYRDIGYVVVRRSDLDSIKIGELEQSGITEINAAWIMRHYYLKKSGVEIIEEGHILEIPPFYYTVVEKGACLDDLGLLWEIFTRRRR